ncbi:DUF4114 domain-containing protein [Komarekiella sp. 'clone 1']|uniref:DUF4114 domain-containing protein n=1 Tax=Komarekiella delphini-convector SJRDD-AB1 TaxID=2593771 RepID=A0AA40VR40_9NOST|nr:DUF4114 domain-containing protein [Komarekiella delphini-convector]MBD6616842.1 DUF4114 domain-containing protein [Komarekiella delphini-convector SJRDD-AB1]
MNNKGLTGLIAAAAATLTSVISAIAPASAADFTWGNWNATTSGVQSATTDTSGFQSLIPNFQQLVQPEGIALQNLNKLDPTKLFLKSESNVRLWFLNEGASYKNQLAYQAINGSQSQKGLIFEDASCKTGNLCEKPSNDGILNVGDYVDLGTIAGGTQINFWLNADGANQNRSFNNVYGAPDAANPDGLEHLVAYEYNGYLLIGFEDLYGSLGSTDGGNISPTDRDFNDVVFVVDFGKDNILTSSVPEPSTAAAMLGVGAIGMLKLRRRRQSKAEKSA